MDLTNKKVLIIGLARSGLAAAKLLCALGAQVTVSEMKPAEEIPEAEELASLGVRLVRQSDEVFAENWDLAVKNPGINGKKPFIVSLRERGIEVITEIELAFRVLAPQQYIAVTGTNGKTTTSTLLGEILSAAHPETTHVTGNIGTALCKTALDFDLLHTPGHYIVLEISNFQLLDIVGFRPNVATILNLAPDHLDFMGSEDAYYRSKCRVYENMTEKDVFLRNVDDPLLDEYLEKLPCRAKEVTFSTKREADVWADEEQIYVFGKALMPLSELKIVGRHNVQNVLAAVAAAKTLGVEDDVIAEAVKSFKGVEHRIEYVRTLDGVKYYNDSKGTNVDATVTALKAFSSPVILLAGGYEKGLSFEPLKPYLAGVKKVVGYGACGPRLIKELTNNEGTLVDTLEDALAAAKAIAEPGDVVLLSPTTSSYDQFTCFEERGERFKALVNAL